MYNRKVYITGVGTISSIGNDFKEFKESLATGQSGVSEISLFDVTGSQFKKGCEIKNLNTSTFFEKRALKRMDRASQIALIATREADSGNLDWSGVDPVKCGVAIGTTLGGMISGLSYYRLLQKGIVAAGRLMDQPMYAVSSRICAAYELKGPNFTVSTACSSSNIALGYAYDLVRTGQADVMLAGGVDSFAEITYSGFGVLRNISHDTIRPFDRYRDGLILGEGAAIMVLASASHCCGRPLAEFLGYGLSSDAYHMTAPDILGRGAAAAMACALRNSGITPDKIDYINAHGTGTRHNDQMETLAIKKVFGDKAYEIPVSSTKSMCGHTLGAAGAIEAAAVIAAIQEGFAPPTISYTTPDPKCDLNYVPNQAIQCEINTAISNNFGFGGNNCSIVLGKVN